jgi:6-phospho-beta-glucosidase
MKIVAILGGGSVWTPCLLDELRTSGILDALTVRLYGLDPSHSRDVERFVRSSMEGTSEVVAVESIADAVDGAHLVLNQARIGGMECRSQDEEICRRLNLVADDSLGLGGLRNAVRSEPFIRMAGRAIRAAAPEAWLVNLSNPTDLLGRMWKATGIRRVVSACDYALKFVRQTANSVGRIPTSVWGYVGMSHMGWATPPEGVTPAQLEEALPEARPWIREFGAVPTPWRVAGLEEGRTLLETQSSTSSRSITLRGLVTQLRMAMRTGDHMFYARVLRQRYPEWYREVIVPLVAGLLLGQADERIVGCPNETQSSNMRDEVFVERWMRIGNGRLESLPLRCPGACTRDIERLAVLRDMAFDLATAPSEDRLRHYMESDPFTSSLQRREMRMELLGI